MPECTALHLKAEGGEQFGVGVCFIDSNMKTRVSSAGGLTFALRHPSDMTTAWHLSYRICFKAIITWPLGVISLECKRKRNRDRLIVCGCVGNDLKCCTKCSRTDNYKECAIEMNTLISQSSANITFSFHILHTNIMHLQWMFSCYFKPLSLSYLAPKFAFALLLGLMSKWRFELWYASRQFQAKFDCIIEQSSVCLRNKAFDLFWIVHFSLFFSVLECCNGCFVEIQYRDQSTLYFYPVY